MKLRAAKGTLAQHAVGSALRLRFRKRMTIRPLNIKIQR